MTYVTLALRLLTWARAQALRRRAPRGLGSERVKYINAVGRISRV